MSNDRSNRHSEWVQAVLEEQERPLVRYALRLTGDLDRARDIVQDVFLRLIAADRNQVEGHVAEWLFTVCRNRCVDVMRKERRMTTLTDERQGAMAGFPQPPATPADSGEQHARVAALLEGLPPRQQEVIRLKFQNGLSYREISRVTELTVSNVGFLIHTGLKTIRERLTTAAGPSSTLGAMR